MQQMMYILSTQLRNKNLTGLTYWYRITILIKNLNLQMFSLLYQQNMFQTNGLRVGCIFSIIMLKCSFHATKFKYMYTRGTSINQCAKIMTMFAFCSYGTCTSVGTELFFDIIVGFTPGTKSVFA